MAASFLLGLFMLNASSLGSTEVTGGGKAGLVGEEGEEAGKDVFGEDGEGGPEPRVVRRCEPLVLRELVLGRAGWADALLVRPPPGARGEAEVVEGLALVPRGTGVAFSRVAEMEGLSLRAAMEGRLPIGVVRPLTVADVRVVAPEPVLRVPEDEPCSSI
mmetsp:Transcript_12585/g.16231  ORF Transcript_12585/g.16231 Transcript_12585/m.16231 type:complete len:160 (-) Transcript_12585:37-516(-)